MDKGDARTAVYDRAMELDPDEFEHLSKVIIEQTEDTTEIELTPFYGDGGIDVMGAVGRDFYNAEFGVQVKQYSKNVGEPAMRSFLGALRSHDYQFGAFIVSSGFSDGAIKTAESEDAHPVTLIDKARLQDIMLRRELGVQQVGEQYDLDDDFWSLFGTETAENVVKSDAVPQADSFGVIDTVLDGIVSGVRYKYEILEWMNQHTDRDDWAPRQSDYYAQALWALGYVHKDPEGEYEGRQMQKWGGTKDGRQYIQHRRNQDDDAADEMLIEHIREADIIEPVLDRLREDGEITYDELGEIIEQNSQLNDTTSDRRRGTVGTWLDVLPEVREAQDGRSKKYEYLEKNLGDY